MNQLLRSATVLACLLALLVATAECKSLRKRSADPAIDSHGSHEHNDAHYKDKGKIEVIAGVKNAVLGFVFDRARRSPRTALTGFAWEDPTTARSKGPTTTEDIVKFTPGKPVSLEIPSELFGSSFGLVTNLSTTIGDYMVNSAIRAQKVLESMRPFLRFLFGTKGFVIEGPTDRPIFSDPNETKEEENKI